VADSGRAALAAIGIPADGRTEFALSSGLGIGLCRLPQGQSLDRPALDPLARDTFRAADSPAPLTIDGP
jgi:hypothetical protein